MMLLKTGQGFMCACGDIRHIMWFTPGDDELYVTVSMSRFRFFSRLKDGMKHIFGIGSDIEEIVLTKEGAAALAKFLNEFTGPTATMTFTSTAPPVSPAEWGELPY